MFLTEKTVDVPNGYRVIQLGEEVPFGRVLRRSKGLREWTVCDWPRTGTRVDSGFANFYAVRIERPEQEW